MNWKIGAKECATKSLYSSNMIPVSITIHDMNDNKPVFSQRTYYQSVDSSLKHLQKVLDFKVTDDDSGIYGVAGLKCELFGTDSNK